MSDVNVSVGVSLRELQQGLGQAGSLVKDFKQEAGKAAAAARFFAGAIENIGGAASGAASLGANLLAGFAMGGPMGLAIGGVNALIAHFKALREEQAKVAEEAKKVFDALITGAKDAAKAMEDARAKSRGLSPEAQDQRSNAAKMQPEIIKADKDLKDKKAALAELEAAEHEGRAYQGLSVDIAAMQAEVEASSKKYDDLENLQRQYLDNASRIESEAAMDRANKEQARNDEAEAKRDAAAQKRQEDLAAIGKATNDAAWKFQEGQAAREEAAAQAEFNRQKELGAALWQLEVDRANKTTALEEKLANQQISNAQAVGASIGNLIGGLITRQATLAQSVAALGQMIIQSVTQTAIAAITADAARAGAGAAASQAGIPVIGPILAVSAMGAIMASVLGLLGNLPSASGGFDIGNYNPITQLHAREMVLPAKLADNVRNMTGNGGNTYVINALDTKSFYQALRANDGALIKVLDRAAAEGRF